MYNKVKHVHDAIKNCLENEENCTCIICPYSHFVDECMKNMLSDASEYIQQLENHIGELTEKVAQLELERNAAVEDAHGVCSACIHFNVRYNPGDIMSCCMFEECIHGADDFDSEDYWQWRGARRVNNDQ